MRYHTTVATLVGMEQADFDWGDKGEAFWRELAERCRQRCGVKATGLQLKFFVVHQTRKVTNAYAAQLAGAEGRTANAGYRLKRSEAYVQLEREIALDGVETKYCDAERRKVILSDLAETGNPSDRLRACQALEVIEAGERDAKTDYPTTMEGLAAEMLKSDDDGAGALALMATYFATAKTLIGLPLKDRIYARVNASFPGLVGQLINLLPPNHYHHADEIRSTANKFSADAMRARGDDRAGSGPEANGNGAAKPGA